MKRLRLTPNPRNCAPEKENTSVPVFTIERSYDVPHSRLATYDAETLANALELDVQNNNWNYQKADYQTTRLEYVTGAWSGNEAYKGERLPLPALPALDWRAVMRELLDSDADNASNTKLQGQRATLDRSANARTAAAALLALPVAPSPLWREITSDLAGALSGCTTQIEQIREMFPGDDGKIAEALENADEAETTYDDAIKSAPVAMARDPALWLDRATNLLIKTLGQWEDEEDSVQEEHEGHINDLRQFVKDWHTNKPKLHPDELARPSRA
ncbi:hypothetical protein FNL56_06155 [Tardiphaga sp. vice304]|uniref:hypothetical protein n=1 Tax=unclassified Tardiphaga TaxID=2631404 RepID=UPI001162DE68|nr:MULTISPECIES: hypothetical protein [unclassified Tardiphaga]QDM15537.1 hypothetical protein FNL53_06090 [Tardiphaga sp. vice278]QDM25735.1 hypothetical protein FNL56_06155 [Tardiphaga sp. vice304]